MYFWAQIAIVPGGEKEKGGRGEKQGKIGVRTRRKILEETKREEGDGEEEAQCG